MILKLYQIQIAAHYGDFRLLLLIRDGTVWNIQLWEIMCRGDFAGRRSFKNKPKHFTPLSKLEALDLKITEL